MKRDDLPSGHQPSNRMYPNWTEADYRPASIAPYLGNPLVEALTNGPMDTNSLLEIFTRDPEFDVRERLNGTEYRLHAVSRLRSFRHAYTRHTTLFSEIHLQLLSGYKERHPDSNLYYSRVQERHREARAVGRWPVIPPKYIAPPAITLIGTSGVGKSAAIATCLSMQPDVIRHPRFGVTQIPNLLVDCPVRGSMKQLGLAILRAVDSKVHTNYEKQFKRGDASEVIARAAKAMAFHYVGVLVIDEVQNLLNFAEGRNNVLASLVQIANSVEVPIVFVGTPKAGELLTCTFAQARRTGSVTYWEPLRAKDLVSSEFGLFLDELWNFQWVRNPGPLDDISRAAIYDVTAGIPELIVHLFMAVQFDIIRSGRSFERIDASAIAKTAQSKFALFARAVSALKEGNFGNEFDDLYLPIALRMRRQ